MLRIINYWSYFICLSWSNFKHHFLSRNREIKTKRSISWFKTIEMSNIEKFLLPLPCCWV